MDLSDNDMPGRPFDYDLHVDSRHAHPKYKMPISNNLQPKPRMNGWVAFGLLLLAAVCFGCGVTVGHGTSEQAPSAVVKPSTVAPAPTVTVVQTVPVASYPASCTMAYETISKMYPDLEVVIDASGKQIVIGNKAYVAIVGKNTSEITKAMADQYDLNRSTSHSTRQLQDTLVELTNQLNQCKIDLGR